MPRNWRTRNSKKDPPMHLRKSGLIGTGKQWAVTACRPLEGVIPKGRTTTNKAKVTCLRCRRIIDAKAKVRAKPKKRKRAAPIYSAW